MVSHTLRLGSNHNGSAGVAGLPNFVCTLKPSKMIDARSTHLPV